MVGAGAGYWKEPSFPGPSNCAVCGKVLKDRKEGITCSQACHEALIVVMEQQFGDYKKVIDQTTGIAYKVPTRYIIEHGLKQTELKNFPQWNGD